MDELRSAVTQRLKEQGQRKSALQLWAKLSAVFNKSGAEGVAEVRVVSVKWWKSHPSSGTVIMPPVLRARALGTRLTPAG